MGPSVVLNVCCPQCHKILLDPLHLIEAIPSLSFLVESEGKKGWLRLSPVYGNFIVQSEYPIPEGAIATFSCPKCKQELKSTASCEVCQAPMVPLLIQEGGRVHICSRRGCKRHFLEFENINEVLAKFYDTYGVGGG